MTSSTQSSSLKISVVINSGEDNDYFHLVDSNDIATVEQMLTNLNPTSKPDWPLSGFRGYGFTRENLISGSTFVRVFAGVITIFDSVGPTYYQDNFGLEDFLNEKNDFMPIGAPESPMIVKRADPAPANQLPKSGSEPPYEPNKWNKNPEVKENNCYAYATNTMGKSFPRPGRAGGQNPPLPGQRGYNCANFVAAAESDGLVKTDCDKACPKCSYKVALVIKPKGRQDYHWYRQDDNGNWSHKQGEDPATDVDEKKNPITDPRIADRGGYTDFCECFCVPPKKIKIRDVDSPVNFCPDGE